MKNISWRSICLLMFLLPVVSCYSQTGDDPDDDDCESKYEAFREAKATLQQIKKDFECGCAEQECAYRQAEWTKTQTVLYFGLSQWVGMVGDIAGNLPTSLPASKIRTIGGCLEKYALSLRRTGALMDADGMMSMLQGIDLPLSWESIIDDILKEIDAREQPLNQQFALLKSIQDNAASERENLKEKRQDGFGDLFDAIQQIQETCDPKFVFDIQSPDWQKCPPSQNQYIVSGWSDWRCKPVFNSISSASNWNLEECQ